MGTKISSLSLKVESIGLTDAAKSMKDLAEASKSVDKETKEFINNQAKIAAATKPANSSMKEQSTSLVVQKRDMDIYNMSAKAYAAAQAEAIKMNKALDNAQKQIELQKQAIDMMRLAESSKAYADAQAEAIKMNKALDAAEKARNLIQQKRDLEMYNQSAKDHAKHLSEQEKALNQLNSRGSIWNNTLKSMAVAASAYIGVNFLKGVIEQADAWSMMQAKLKLATGSMEDAKQVQTDLYKLAQKIRIPLEDSAQLYNRMTIPMQKMGKSAEDTMQMVESMGLALKLSGASAQEASSVMLQFSQSMNAGRLNGGEFNAVAEGAPIILRAIEQELRRTGQWGEHTTETLKKMGSEGKISAELLARSMQNSLPAFRKDFDTLPLTVDGAMQRIKNAWFAAIGDMAQDSELSKKLAESIKNLEEEIPKFAKLVVNALIFVNDHFGMIVTSIGILTGASIISGIGTLVGGLYAMATAAMAVSTAVAAIPFIGLIGTLATLSFNLGYLAAEWIDSKINAEEYAKTSAAAIKTSNSDVESAIEALKKQNTQLAEQLKLIKGIKGEIDEAPKSNPQEDLAAQLRLEVAVGEKALKRFENSKTAGAELLRQTMLQKTTQLAALEQEIELVKKAKEEVAAATKQKEEGMKYASLNQKYHFDTKALIDAEIEGLKGAGLSADQYAKASAKIRENYKETAGSDKFKAMREEVVKISISASEWLEKTKQLQKYGIDDKRLESQKLLNRLQGEANTLTDKTAISLNAKAQAQAVIAEQNEREYMLERKIQTAWADKLAASDKTLQAAEAERDKQKNLYEAYGLSEQALQALTDAKLQDQLVTAKGILKDLTFSGIDSEIVKQQQLVDQLKATIEARKEAAKYKDLIAGKEEVTKNIEKASTLLDKLLDPKKASKFGDAFKDSMSKPIKAVTNLSKVFSDMYRQNEENLQLQQAAETKYGKGTIDYENALQEIKEKNSQDSVTLWGNMAEASKGFFKEGSKGYQTMNAVSAVFHAAQLARNTIEMGQMAIKAVMNQANGDPYTAWARMAAMAAAVAALGFAVGGFGSSGSGGMKAADVQKTQGTGSVFGDSGAKSDSISKSIEALTKNSDVLLPVNQGMLDALRNIESSMSGVSNILLRNQGVTNGTNMGIATGTLSKGSGLTNQVSWLESALLGGIFGVTAKLLGNLWGKTTQNVVDSGLQFGGSFKNLQQGQGFNQYASVDTTKSSWFGLSKKTSNSVQTQGLNAELSQQLGMIFAGMGDAMVEASKALGVKTEDTVNKLNNLTLSVQKISLKGLTGTALTEALNAVISKSLDEMAEAVFPAFDKFRKVGEGYAQTILRVADTVSKTNSLFSQMNLKLFDLTSSGIDAAMSFTELVGGLDELKSITSSYVKNFFTEAERNKATVDALTKQFEAMNETLPLTRNAYRELVERTTDPDKLAKLLKLSDAFASVFEAATESLSDADKLAAKMKPLEDAKEALKTLGEEASSWLDLRKRAADLKDAVDSALGGAKDPSKRIAELWKMMSQDVTLDQKVALAGELKDLVLQKYQVEKENFTKLLEYGKQLRNYVDGLKVGGLSPLTMTQKLAEAQKQYQETLAAAQGGDVTAQGQLQSKAETFLQLAQTAYASSGAYTDIFTSVTQALDALGVESISTADKANQIATDQYAELQKLSNYLGETQDLAQTYYDQSLNKMQAQVDAIQTLAGKLGVLEGITSFLKDLPAEIAATLSARSGNGEFVAGLYSSIAGKSGSQIDQQGMDYWTSQAAMYGRQYTEDSFKSAVALMGNKAPITTTPIDSATLSAQVEVLTTAVNELKETSINNTAALINATVNSNVVSAETIVEGTSDAIASAMFKSQNGVELV